MLPAAKSHRFRLADVLPNCLDALAGRRGPLGLAPVDHAIVLLVDGLGWEALGARLGHARTLAGRVGVDAPIGAGFPTTTASALASLTTGAAPGQHGLVGYSVLDPAGDRVVNQLTGWGAGVDPATWQRVPTLFQSSAPGVTSVVVAPERYRDSGFTQAVLRGAEFRGGRSIADRFALVRDELDRPGPRLVYLYVPELDVAGHAHGVESPPWTAALEELDGALAGLVPALGPRAGLVVTADHGMVDVVPEAHRIVPPELLAEIRHLAGEPRALQLHLEPGVDPHAHAQRWRDREGARAWVATRAEAIEAGLFGDVHPDVAPRIGDVLVLARKPVAYYADAASPARGMVGQHGSLTPAETGVPLLRFGAWAS
jgi:predicted AlkP superfamily pyrophosphatase or phosphodiesterase